MDRENVGISTMVARVFKLLGPGWEFLERLLSADQTPMFRVRT